MVVDSLEDARQPRRALTAYRRRTREPRRGSVSSTPAGAGVCIVLPAFRFIERESQGERTLATT